MIVVVIILATLCVLVVSDGLLRSAEECPDQRRD